MLHNLLLTAVTHEASDLHLKSDSRAFLRIKEKLVPLGNNIIPAAELETLILSTMNDEQKIFLLKHKEIDYALNVPNIGRFRVNAYTAQGNIEAVLRVVSETVKTSEELHLPTVINTLASLNDGLVLVSGATGSGKSTTLASMIDFINHKEQKRIITIENPVEILHKDDRSVISQREVGGDTESFGIALRSILRQNPDIILIGEIRDKETADSALRAAQTGHLVFSTIHAGTAEETVNRFAGLFPPEERPNVKRALAYSLKGILAQRLVLDTMGNKIPILEIMVSNNRIVQAILADAEDDSNGESITKVIQESGSFGMNTLDQYLLKLISSGQITLQDALNDAVNPLTLKQAAHQKGITS